MPSDARWALLEPLVEACRPEGETPPQDLRRTISATLSRRHQNGARWRAVPNGLGPRWRAAQVLVRWARAPAPGSVCWTLCGSGACGQLGTAFLDGTSARAHRKAAGAARRGDLELSETSVRRLAGLGAAMAPKPARSPTGLATPPPCGSRPVGGTSCPGPSRPSTDRRACPSGPWPTAATPAAASASTSGAWARGRRSRRGGTRRRPPCPDWIPHHRDRVERLWARPKERRAVATRYEKAAPSFRGVLCLAAALDRLRLKRWQALMLNTALSLFRRMRSRFSQSSPDMMPSPLRT